MAAGQGRRPARPHAVRRGGDRHPDKVLGIAIRSWTHDRARGHPRNARRPYGSRGRNPHTGQCTRRVRAARRPARTGTAPRLSPERDPDSAPARRARRSAGRPAPRAARRPTTTTSSSEPSSARAASPALLSISSAILVSMVCAAMIRHAVTGSLLTDAVDPVDGLGLLGVGPGQLGEHDVGGDLEVEPDAGRGQRADHDRDVGVVDEGVDVASAAPSAVWSPRIEE